MKVSISQNQEDTIGSVVLALDCKVHEEIKHTREEGGPCKPDLLHDVVVISEHVVDAVDLRLVEATVERETVADRLFTHVFRDTSKAEGWISLELIVALENSPDFLDSLRILVDSSSYLTVRGIWIIYSTV